MSEIGFLSLADAAVFFGYKSGAAMLKAFKRGKLPKRYLYKIGPRSHRVDKVGLEQWTRERALEESGGPSLFS